MSIQTFQRNILPPSSGFLLICNRLASFPFFHFLTLLTFNLTMKAADSFETSRLVAFYQTTWHRILRRVSPTFLFPWHSQIAQFSSTVWILLSAFRKHWPWNVRSNFRIRTVQWPKNVKKKKIFPRNRPWRPIGLWDVKDPTLSRQSAHS
jgi:hypothetical protein